ncbi:non-canonical purine NTP pyrophosphatase, RdgB/HAM1 family [candidate division WOR-1 bacterium RIFOXYB2_FULL_42_35]|uniref:dITP/XTP pyrophosphatase n=1 Tax=candidate division WOR-1 bacterium RIFOXYC2_FULL_41_25 TaxID=1802586 RepID=A0A1F4TPV1_UNCSA|nr:MAG: non-canonical purine NTP pyrophosphatase, RdgB/HAM1 family [candidate division WOR-1 bacterium RIFOXYA2_FULL_41_14]OGC25196.1 MAG: non-canonical purine NTP pyrophosphatase, RdgB/HAM1 family [candidate division WOR-1 bacterium RIFOXYB2_FULL_42_35]OGC34752.1 MAG: non-canonical purine NTP pyrophosphatase, RdgB/HAM1 family [candidate division WOR-1 bacterium RIFOXYC2_FULL_41_25]OGC44132.1 MAG: non-canonical purine NTP pyrophosphatase, RdgB/HAM1 family [candidate division WOR-1 bacterium RIFO
MMQILVATGNKHKLREVKQILKLRVTGCELRVHENGKTFEANAIKKAKAIKLKPGQIAIADDSGLEVKALNGKPGIKSARFAGPNPTPEKLCTKLLRVMSNVNEVMRIAQFVCVIAIVYPNGEVKTVKGICKGKIIHEMRGERGFGYDPVFVPQGYKKTFAEMSPVMKNRLSHRGRALKKLKELL